MAKKYGSLLPPPSGYKEAMWLAEYLHELTVFPKGKHDDQSTKRRRRGLAGRSTKFCAISLFTMALGSNACESGLRP
jgi:hypothetical protein